MDRKKIGFVVIIFIVIGLIMLPTSPDIRYEIHMTVTVHRDGKQIYYSHHAGVLTTLGLNWAEDQLFDSPGTDPAKWIGLSNDASSPSAAWTAIPNEITGNGLARAPGTYVDNGDGECNVTKTFTATGSQSVQLAGLYWALTGDYLFCSDTMSPVSLQANDQLSVTFTITMA